MHIHQLVAGCGLEQVCGRAHKVTSQVF